MRKYFVIAFGGAQSLRVLGPVSKDIWRVLVSNFFARLTAVIATSGWLFVFDNCESLANFCGQLNFYAGAGAGANANQRSPHYRTHFAFNSKIL